MRTKLIAAFAAAFALSSVAAVPFAASAAPTAAEMKKAGEIKDPVKADAAVSKFEAKDAKAQAHRAKKKAKKAHHAAAKAAKAAG